MTFFEQIFEILQAYYVRLFDIEYFAPQTHFKFQGIQSNRATNCLPCEFAFKTSTVGRMVFEVLLH